MNDPFDRIFRDLDRDQMSRRELFRVLGLAALAVPAASFAQGGGDTTGRGGRGNRAPADTTHALAPFEPTGWKTVWLDHMTYKCQDYPKAVAFYSAVMGWKLRSDDGKQAVMDIGDDAGGVIMTNGFVPPPPRPAPPADSAGGGRGGGRGTRPQPMAAITNFAWGIEPWNTNKVEAELRKRGLNPVADHAGDFKSFHIKDPDGFDIQVTNGTKANRRKGAANAKLSAPLPFEPTGWKTGWVDHISYGCSDYKRTVAFYEALVGWTPGRFNGNQSIVDMGDVGGAIIRNRPGGVTTIDHISFGIEGFDPDRVEEELMKRHLGSPNRQDPTHLAVDTGGGGDIHTSKFKSYHTPDVFNWDLQISNILRANRHDT
jgi:catechol 2,3-dioxygenase-like lactoylglutathione lyase family enzyme